MKKFLAGLTAGLLSATALVAPAAISAQSIAGHAELGKTPKNVILLIPDGMGTNDMLAYRMYKNGGYAAELPYTVMDQYLVGQMMTAPENDLAAGDSTITDSAAAGTAMSSGEKTYSGAIGLDNDQSVLENTSEVAKANGKSVGIVVTCDVFHATPASFHSHVPSRKDYDKMLEDMISDLEGEGVDFDVLLGGGRQYFKTEETDFTQNFVDAGFTYVESKDELAAAEGDKVLGLFSEDALPYDMDTTDENIPSLAEMTTAALDKLSQNDNGFFLMVEASEIDWANHANDLTGMMSEIEAYEEAFQAAIDFAKEDGETLVIAAADHETGGFTAGGRQKDGKDEQQFIIDPVLGMKETPQLLAARIEESGDVEGTLAEYVEWKFTNEEISTMEDALTMGDGAYDTIYQTLIDAVNYRANAGWTSGQHTGGEVSFYAYGPGFENFIGLIDNTDVAKIVKAFLAGQEPTMESHEATPAEQEATEEAPAEETVEEGAEETSVEESAEEGAEEGAEEESSEESSEETSEETAA